MPCCVLASHPVMLKSRLKMKMRYIGSNSGDILHEGLWKEMIMR